MRHLYVLLILFSIIGCSQIIKEIGINRIPDPPPTKIPVKGVKGGIEYVNNATSGARDLTFSDVNQTYDIKPGEQVIISLEYNLAGDNDLFIMSRYNKDKNIITINLYDHFWDKQITLKSKCEVVEVRGLYDIPAINVDPVLELAQIIITPILNKKCERFGFQIRYGENCKDTKAITIYDGCTGHPPSSKCYEKVWFDIDCP